jgi:hypothetical protein
MDRISNQAIAVLLVLVVAVLVATGAGVNWWIMHPVQVVEVAAPAVQQKDGSIIAEKKPNAKAKPKQTIPKGAKVERLGEITVQGPTPEANLKMPGALPCPPVTIDTTLIRNVDGSKRLIVSSPDGRVDRAVDIPVETAAPLPEPKKWAAGLSYSLTKQTSGVWLERDLFGRVRMGAEINQTRQEFTGATGVEARLRLGWTF